MVDYRRQDRLVRRCIAILLLVLVIVILFQLRHSFNIVGNSIAWRTTTSNADIVQSEKLFKGFNNVTGTNVFIVPNIIHFIRFNMTEFSFVDFICLRAAFRNHRPDHFFIHTDVQFTGKYWQWIQRDKELRSRIRILSLDAPTEIYGQPLSDAWRFSHGSDIARVQVLMKYGGIYLDNDVYLIHNLNK